MTTTRTLRLAIAGALMAWLLLIAADVHPAEWIKFRFTAPADSLGGPGETVSGVGRYRMEAHNGVSWDSVRIYRAQGVEGVPVAPAGQACSLYVSQTVATHTSRRYRLVAIDLRGNRAESSNWAIVATGFPDTIVGLSRPARGLGLAFQRTYGLPVSWRLRPADSADVHALHQEVIQRASRARICELFSSWGLRGGQEPCP